MPYGHHCTQTRTRPGSNLELVYTKSCSLFFETHFDTSRLACRPKPGTHGVVHARKPDMIGPAGKGSCNQPT